MNEETFEQKCQFTVQLIQMAHQSGASFARLESFIPRLKQALDLEIIFVSIVSVFFFDFRRSSEGEPRRITIPISDGAFDLSKLSEIDELIDKLTKQQIPLVEAMSRLEEIQTLGRQYNPRMVGLGYLLAGLGIAVLLSANWFDSLIAAVLSLVVYGIVLSTGRSEWLANRVNLTAAFVASVLANLVAILIPGSNPFVVALSSVIILVPGLSLTLGVAEMVSKNVISGLNRLIAGLLITASLFIGTILGSSAVNAFWTVPPSLPSISTASWVKMIFAVVVMLGISLVFQVRIKDLGWVLIGGGLAYTGSLLGNELGAWQGAFLGALVLGIYAGVFSLISGRPGSIVLLSGIMILVPGVAAYFGLNTLESSGILSAIISGWGVFVQIAAILAGLFVAASFLPRRASL